MTSISGLGDLLIKWENASVDSLIKDRIWVAIDFFIYFSVFVAVVLIVVAGYMFITSAGNPEKVQRAQKVITGAIVGMVIVFLARMIVGFVFDVLRNNGDSGNDSKNEAPMPNPTPEGRSLPRPV